MKAVRAVRTHPILSAIQSSHITPSNLTTMSLDTTPTPTPTANTDRTPLYEGSTQYRHWRFSPEELLRARTSLNEGAVSAIRDAFEADSAGRILYVLEAFLVTNMINL